MTNVTAVKSHTLPITPQEEERESLPEVRFATRMRAGYGCSDGMKDSIRFSIVKLAPGQTPSVCPLCNTNSALFEYTRSSDLYPSEDLQGRCCLSCTQRLLTTMQELAIAEWTKNLPPG